MKNRVTQFCELSKEQTKMLFLILLSAIVLCNGYPTNTKVKRDAPFDVDAYLEKYGYLTPSNDNSQGFTTHSEHSRSHAIRLFQTFAHLPETGRINRETIEAMKRPRCGFPDIINNSNDPGTPLKFTAGPKWKNKTVTWRISSYTDKLTVQEQRTAIENSFQHWKNVSGLSFIESNETSNIDILFASGYHGDGLDNAFDGAGGVLAHAFLPEDGRTHFDNDEFWVFHQSEGAEIEMIATHELGHSLGLSHTIVRGAVMAPFYQQYSENFTLHADDIAGIQSLYGQPEIVNKSATETSQRNITTTSKLRPEIFVTNVTHLPVATKPEIVNETTSNLKNVTSPTSEIFVTNSTAYAPVATKPEIVNEATTSNAKNVTTPKSKIFVTNVTADLPVASKPDVVNVTATSHAKNVTTPRPEIFLTNVTTYRPVTSKPEVVNEATTSNLKNVTTVIQNPEIVTINPHPHPTLATSIQSNVTTVKPRVKEEKLCETKIDAAIPGEEGTLQLFIGKFIYKIYENCNGTSSCIVDGYPKKIRKVFRKGPKRVKTAAYLPDERKRTYLFNGRKMWRYTGKKLDRGYPKQMDKKDLPYKPNAAYIYKNQFADYQWYIFAGKYFWELNLYVDKMTNHVMKTKIYWDYLHVRPDAMLQTRDGMLYVFKGKYYNKYDHRRVLLEKKKNIARDLLGAECF